MDKIQVKVSYMVRWGLQGVILEKDPESLKNMDFYFDSNDECGGD